MQTFIDIVIETTPELVQIDSFNFDVRIIAWRYDYTYFDKSISPEYQGYSIYNQIPEDIAFFWSNLTKTELYKFEKDGEIWKLTDQKKI